MKTQVNVGNTDGIARDLRAEGFGEVRRYSTVANGTRVVLEGEVASQTLVQAGSGEVKNTYRSVLPSGRVLAHGGGSAAIAPSAYLE